MTGCSAIADTSAIIKSSMGPPFFQHLSCPPYCREQSGAAHRSNLFSQSKDGPGKAVYAFQLVFFGYAVDIARVPELGENRTRHSWRVALQLFSLRFPLVTFLLYHLKQWGLFVVVVHGTFLLLRMRLSCIPVKRLRQFEVLPESFVQDFNDARRAVERFGTRGAPNVFAYANVARRFLWLGLC
jgi:hypothetical protein